MIELTNVSIRKPGFSQQGAILRDASFRFAMGERVGILAVPGSGKSTIARTISGIDHPDTGTVKHSCRVSWPIGMAGFLHPDLTVGANLQISARMVGLDPDYMVGFCTDFCEDPPLAQRLMKNLSPTKRALLAFVCSIALPGPAMWVADEIISVGEPNERKRCEAALKQKIAEGGFVFLSRNPRLIIANCNRFLVLLNQRLIEVDDINVAQKALDLSLQQTEPTETRPEHV